MTGSFLLQNRSPVSAGVGYDFDHRFHHCYGKTVWRRCTGKTYKAPVFQRKWLKAQQTKPRKSRTSLVRMRLAVRIGQWERKLRRKPKTALGRLSSHADSRHIFTSIIAMPASLCAAEQLRSTEAQLKSSQATPRARKPGAFGISLPGGSAAHRMGGEESCFTLF